MHLHYKDLIMFIKVKYVISITYNVIVSMTWLNAESTVRHTVPHGANKAVKHCTRLENRWDEHSLLFTCIHFIQSTRVNILVSPF